MQITELENRKIFWLDFVGKKKHSWRIFDWHIKCNIPISMCCEIVFFYLVIRQQILCARSCGFVQFDQSISNPQWDEMNWWLHFHARAIFQWPNTPTFHFCIHFLKCRQCWMQFYNINNPRTSISKVFVHISFSFCSRTTSFLIDDAHKMLHKILTSVCLEYAWVWDVLTAHYAHY